MDAMGWIECRPWAALPWSERLAVWTVGAVLFAEGQQHPGDASECDAFGYLPMTFSLATESALRVLRTRPPPSPDMDPRERRAAIGELLVACLEEYEALTERRAVELGGFH